MKIALLLALAGALIGLFVAPYTPLWILVCALLMAALHRYPIHYPSRSQVASQARQTLRWWASPLPYLALLLLVFLWLT
ncbi:hypothetical protein [Ferrimonas balearica]|uniref:hypothetical protein n=1 Tax=Ferrimonas balearica TaxID=44012 RepID=UPI001C99981D|nr:hypothetical protein [Ferrimonas balearica]MBY5994135.1 hypothetical protein [Ferrimonas balearica]